jgi:hypothetical protein
MNWRLIKEESGIKLYTNKPNQFLLSWPISSGSGKELLDILLDYSHYGNWFADTRDIEIVSSDPLWTTFRQTMAIPVDNGTIQRSIV